MTKRTAFWDWVVAVGGFGIGVVAFVAMLSLVSPNRALMVSDKAPPATSSAAPIYAAGASNSQVGQVTSDVAELKGQIAGFEKYVAAMMKASPSDTVAGELRDSSEMISSLRVKVETLEKRVEGLRKVDPNSELELHIAVESAMQETERDWVRRELEQQETWLQTFIFVILGVAITFGIWGLQKILPRLNSGRSDD